jgi:hypothetical protein
MDCEQFDAVLDRAGRQSDLTDEGRGHLAECSRCQALYAWLSEGPPVDVLPSVHDRAIRGLAGSLKPVRPVSGRAVTVLQIWIVFAVLAAGLLAFMGTAGIAHMTGFQLIVMSSLLIAGTGLFSLSLAGQMRPGARPYVRGAATLSLVALAGIAWLFPWGPAPEFVAMGWPCLLSGLAMAAFGGLLLALVVRRGAPVSPRMMGATLGATAGWLGVAVLQYRCPLQQAEHLLVWHGGVLVLAAPAGLAIADWLRDSRRSSRAVV